MEVSSCVRSVEHEKLTDKREASRFVSLVFIEITLSLHLATIDGNLNVAEGVGARLLDQKIPLGADQLELDLHGIPPVFSIWIDERSKIIVNIF